MNCVFSKTFNSDKIPLKVTLVLPTERIMKQIEDGTKKSLDIEEGFTQNKRDESFEMHQRNTRDSFNTHSHCESKDASILKDKEEMEKVMENKEFEKLKHWCPEGFTKNTSVVAMECSDMERTRTRTISLGEEDVLTLGANRTNGWHSDYVYEAPLTSLWRDNLLTGLMNNIWPSCLCAFFIPCMIGSQMGERLKWHTFLSTSMTYTTTCVLCIIIWLYVEINCFLLYYLLLVYLAWVIRDRLRTAFQIPGHSLNDCFASFFLMPCVVAQNARQLYKYEQIFVFDKGTCLDDGAPRWGERQCRPAPSPPDTCNIERFKPTLYVVSGQPLTPV